MKKQSREDLDITLTQEKRPKKATNKGAAIRFRGNSTRSRNNLPPLRQLFASRPGVEPPGQSKARGRLIPGISRKLRRPYQSPSDRLGGAEDTIAFCENHFRLLIERALQDEMHVVTLNAAHRVIRSHQVTVGLLNSAPVHPREVFRPAILDSAAAIILVHNHPSGNSEPSKADLKVTDDIEAAARMFGIPLIDHIIVAKTRCVSIFEWRKPNAKTATLENVTVPPTKGTGCVRGA